jgi:HAD superfamily hydrolase (TIGR01549 family)
MITDKEAKGLQVIDTILFDWDGTLIDSADNSFLAAQQALADLGFLLSPDFYASIYSPDWRRIYAALEVPHNLWERADELWIRYYEKRRSQLLEGAHPVIRKLKRSGYSLGIVTSGSHSRVRREIGEQNLGDCFRTIVCSEDFSNKKPHPEGLVLAMKQLCRPASVCIYVGDSPEDIEMGKRAGVAVTIGVFSAYPTSIKLPLANPDICLASIAGLLSRFACAGAESELRPSVIPSL